MDKRKMLTMAELAIAEMHKHNANETHQWLIENETAGDPEEVKEKALELIKYLRLLHSTYERTPYEETSFSLDLYDKYLLKPINTYSHD